MKKACHLYLSDSDMEDYEAVDYIGYGIIQRWRERNSRMKLAQRIRVLRDPQGHDQNDREEPKEGGGASSASRAPPTIVIAPAQLPLQGQQSTGENEPGVAKKHQRCAQSPQGKGQTSVNFATQATTMGTNEKFHGATEQDKPLEREEPKPPSSPAIPSRDGTNPEDDDGRKSPAATEGEGSVRSWTLHVPERSGNANVAELLRKMEDADDRRELESIILREEKYLEAARRTPKTRRSQFSNRVREKHREEMIKAGILKETKQHPIFWCKVFTIPEPAKKRYRLIVEPRDLNKSIQYRKTKLPTVKDMMELVNEGNVLVQWDLACWFYQIPLAPEIQKYFGVKIEGKDYVFTCLPMGFTASVLVAQHLALTATSYIQGRRVYIDNIFTACPAESEAEKCKAKMQVALNMYNIASKATATESGPELNILGIHCDAVNKSLRLDERFVEKYRDMLKMLKANALLALTTRDLMKIIGVLFRGVYVLQLGFHNYLLTLRTASKASKFELDACLNWKVDSNTAELAQTVLNNEPVYYRQSEDKVADPPTLVTDASRDGFGYIWVHNGRIVFGGGKWNGPVEDNMPELEAAAGIIAMETLEQYKFRIKDSNLFTDSMTAIQAEMRGHSTSPLLNKFIGLIKANRITTNHVRSEENPADGLSRGLGLSSRDLEKLEYLCSPPVA